jgi:hypothetical protein
MGVVAEVIEDRIVPVGQSSKYARSVDGHARFAEGAPPRTRAEHIDLGVLGDHRQDLG